MRVEPASRGPLLHVVSRMRDIDHREVFGLRWHESADDLADEMLRMTPWCWVARAGDGEPVYAFGVRDLWPGVCAIGGFSTDRWPEVLAPVTRFTLKLIKAALADGFMHRIECVSIADKLDGHKWLERLGAEREGVLRGYGRHREDYIRFVWR